MRPPILSDLPVQFLSQLPILLYSLAMEALLPSLSSSLPLTVPPSNNTLFRPKSIASTANLLSQKRCVIFNGNRRSTATIAAINEVSAATTPAEVEVTWQIVVGVIGTDNC
jgi:hypothetical protein